jgi:precorrin-8X/cobalt-precorrin-8 methylmutase
MEKIVLVGHGSPKQDANNVEIIAGMVHRALHPNCADACVKVAYLQFARPDIETVIDTCVSDGARRVIVHPFFLYSGMHVTRDIPDVIADAAHRYPGVEFIYTDPLGTHEGLAGIVMERINSVRFPVPRAIEERSFEIISGETDLSDVPEEQLPIVTRVIHATADFEFKQSLTFHPEAVRTGIDAIRAGKDILTDVEMVRTGINKRLLTRWGGTVLCGIQADAGGTEDHRQKTRAEQGIEKVLKENEHIGIVAIGNAPTALMKVIDLFGPGCSRTLPLPLVVGVPVGFVKALESKSLLALQAFPFITNLSRKGGTPAAVAIVNALLKMAAE